MNIRICLYAYSPSCCSVHQQVLCTICLSKPWPVGLFTKLSVRWIWEKPSETPVCLNTYRRPPPSASCLWRSFLSSTSPVPALGSSSPSTMKMGQSESVVLCSTLTDWLLKFMEGESSLVVVTQVQLSQSPKRFRPCDTAPEKTRLQPLHTMGQVARWTC